MTPPFQEHFREIWCVDFEFSAKAGERPCPICCVAHELFSGRTVRLWEDDFSHGQLPPYATNKHALVVAYYASAEIGCHLVLDWPTPENLLDLYVEFRNLTNGRTLPCGASLLGAQVSFGLPAIETLEKETMRQLALRGGPWTPEERASLMAYCESDVIAVTRLLLRMAPFLDLPRALLRGRYMIAAAHIEHTGTPIDLEGLLELREHWESIQDRLIAIIDVEYGVFEGRTFKAARWEQWLKTHDIVWPRHSTGRLKLDEETFREMAKVSPSVQPIHQLRTSLAQMRLAEITVGADGRNRCLLSAFRAKTGRNQPSTTQFIFGPAVWIRGLIKPPAGRGLAYIDYAQQEFGIAAYLSADQAMRDAYASEDPYLVFAKQAGAVPSTGSRETHSAIREQFKACALGVLYGMGPKALAQRIGQSEAHARELLRLHRETYPIFWQWSDAVVDYAILHERLNTVLGWTIHLGEQVTTRTLRNFPMQANGAEMLRLACCLTTEQGIEVCAPIHDALLVEASIESLDGSIRLVQDAMGKASAVVLGTPLRTDVKVVRYPDRYHDERGTRMWGIVWQVLEDVRDTSLV